MIDVSWGGIGDCLLTTPSIKALHKQIISSRLFVVCNIQQQSVLLHNPYIHEIVVDNKSIRRLFRKMNFLYRTNYNKYKPSLQNKHAVDVIGEMMEVDIEERSLEVYLSEEEETHALSILAGIGGKKVVVSSESSSENKNWSIENWNLLTDKLKEYTFIQIGKSDEKRIHNSIDLRGKVTINEAIALIKHSDLLVSVDSVWNHVSNATKTKAIILWGATNPSIWGYDDNVNIYKKLTCSPCIDSELFLKCTSRNCMHNISVQDVIDSVSSIFNN